MGDNVKPFRLSADAALKRIRELAEDSRNVFITRHALQRMVERQITRLQVIECLLRGVVSEGPALDPHGNWKCTLRRFAAGQELEVVVALQGSLIVITVY
jgi:hypothetical protein